MNQRGAFYDARSIFERDHMNMNIKLLTVREEMDNCNQCNGLGWIPYYEIVNRGEANEGYYKTHRECNKCDATGKRNKYNLGMLGIPGDTGFILGKRAI